MLLYSRLEIGKSEIHYLIEKDVPSFELAITTKTRKKFKLFTVHPKPPSPSQNSTSLPRDAELIAIGKKAAISDLPVLVTGVLNDVAWSHTTRLFMRISGLLDPRMGRGFFNTYHAHYPLLRRPLDHMFVSPHFKLKSIRRLDNFNSDHFPICAELTIYDKEHSKKNLDEKTISDLREAQDKINRQES